jgi:hypothetical protein
MQPIDSFSLILVTFAGLLSAALALYNWRLHKSVGMEAFSFMMLAAAMGFLFSR